LNNQPPKGLTLIPLLVIQREDNRKDYLQWALRNAISTIFERFDIVRRIGIDCRIWINARVAVRGRGRGNSSQAIGMRIGGGLTGHRGILRFRVVKWSIVHIRTTRGAYKQKSYRYQPSEYAKHV